MTDKLDSTEGQPLLVDSESQIGLRSSRLRSVFGWQVKICVIPLTRFAQLWLIWNKLAC